MQKIKNEKGITLVVLILTVVLLAIIVAVSINYAYDGINYSNEQKIVTELNEVQQAIIQKYSELKKLGLDKDLDTYKNIAKKLDVSRINIYSDELEHEYLNEEDVTCDKYYFGLTKSDLDKLGMSIKKDIKEKDFTFKENGEVVLYIVNFYYGEVLNVYNSENFKTDYSGKHLYTIGKTVDENSLYGNGLVFYLGDKEAEKEYENIDVKVLTEIESDTKDSSRAKLTFTITNKSDKDLRFDLAELNVGNTQNLSNVWGGPYIVDWSNSTVKISPSNVTIPAKGTDTFNITLSYSGYIPEEMLKLTDIQCK